MLVAVLAVAGVVTVLRAGGGRSEPDPAEAGAAVGSPRQGGTLRIGVVRPATLDPMRARSTDELLLADQLFDGLTAYDPDSLEPAPAVARRWTASPDQRTWDFQIDPAARFADGRAITADDVVYTLERIVARGSGASVADLLEPVSGYKAVRIDGATTDLAGVTATAPDTVQILLDQPLAVLPAVLASPAFGIVPREAVEAVTPVFGEQPVGSGPFRLDPGGGLIGTLRLVPAAGRQVLVDALQVSLFDDRAAAYDAFRDGDLDWTEVPPEQVESAAADVGTEGFTPYVAELFYGFNLKSPKFADVRFREAIVRSIDREAIVSAVYGDTVRPVEGLVVAGVPGAVADPCGTRCDVDVDRARALLAEVFPAPEPGAPPAVPEVAIDYDDDRTQEAVAQAMKASLEAVGIPVVLRPKPLQEYQAFAVSGEQELFRLGWIAPYLSADAFLTPLFQSASPSNVTGLSSPEIDALLAAARATGDVVERRRLYQQAEEVILAQVPVVPIAQFELHGVSSARVQDLRLNPLGTFDATRVWLSAGDP